MENLQSLTETVAGAQDQNREAGAVKQEHYLLCCPFGVDSDNKLFAIKCFHTAYMFTVDLLLKTSSKPLNP